MSGKRRRKVSLDKISRKGKTILSGGLLRLAYSKDRGEKGVAVETRVFLFQKKRPQATVPRRERRERDDWKVA